MRPGRFAAADARPRSGPQHVVRLVLRRTLLLRRRHRAAPNLVANFHPGTKCLRLPPIGRERRQIEPALLPRRGTGCSALRAEGAVTRSERHFVRGFRGELLRKAQLQNVRSPVSSLSSGRTSEDPLTSARTSRSRFRSGTSAMLSSTPRTSRPSPSSFGG